MLITPRKIASGLVLLVTLTLMVGGYGLAQQGGSKDDYKSPTLPGQPVVPPKGKEEPKKEEPKVQPKETPKETEKKEDAPPAVTESPQEGKMPLDFVSNKLGNLAIDEKVYIMAKSVKVDSERRCYIDQNTVYYSVPIKRNEMVQIYKTSDGYHIRIAANTLKHQWYAEDDPVLLSLTRVKTVGVLK